MNWKAWLQMALGVLATVPGTNAAILAMIGTGILSLDDAKEEDIALGKKWFDWCNNVIVVEKRDFTEEERAEARAFADQVHAANQAA